MELRQIDGPGSGWLAENSRSIRGKFEATCRCLPEKRCVNLGLRNTEIVAQIDAAHVFIFNDFGGCA